MIFWYFFLNPHLDRFFVESNGKGSISMSMLVTSFRAIFWPKMFPLFQDMMGNMMGYMIIYIYIIWWEYYTRYIYIYRYDGNIGIPAICHIISCYLSHTHICSPWSLSKAPQSMAGLGGAGTPHPPWLHAEQPKVGELNIWVCLKIVYPTPNG